MQVYTFGDPAAPAILLLPGTCCHRKGADKYDDQIRGNFS